MNRYLKGCLVVLVIIILFISGVVGWYYQNKAAKQQQAQTDEIRFSKICDRPGLVVEKPSVMLVGFDSIEVRRLRFHLMRQGSLVQDTVVFT